jgi:hypothetical protein
VHATAAVLVEIDVALRVHAMPCTWLNSPGKLPGRPKLPRLFPVARSMISICELFWLITNIRRWAGIGREVDGDRRTAALLDHAILWRRISHESRAIRSGWPSVLGTNKMSA